MKGSNNARTTTVVGIAGGSGSGKTTFAERLRVWFGSCAVVLSHDDYYKHKPEMTQEEALAYDFDSPDALDTELLVQHVRALKNGEAVDVPAYDFASHARTQAARHVGPASVVLVEGLLILAVPELAGLFDLTVFLDADSDVRVLRRIRRDCNERGADLERAIAMYLATTKQAEAAYVEPFKSSADLVVHDALGDRALEAVAWGIAGMAGLAQVHA